MFPMRQAVDDRPCVQITKRILGLGELETSGRATRTGFRRNVDRCAGKHRCAGVDGCRVPNLSGLARHKFAPILARAAGADIVGGFINETLENLVVGRWKR